MDKPKRVKCINNKGVKLTFYEVYTVLHEKDGFYQIQDDNGDRRIYKNVRFEEL